MNNMQAPDQADTTDMTTPDLYPWAPHLAGMTHDEVDTFDTICQHEIAHGVMRWLLGHRATEIRATPAEGHRAGTGKRIDTDQALLITLAGPAHEMCFLPGLIDWDNAGGRDFDEARGLLEPWHQRISIKDGSPVTLGVNEAMELWLGNAAEMLWPYHGFIGRAAVGLRAKGMLSARSFAMMLRNYDGALRRQAHDRLPAAASQTTHRTRQPK